MSKIVDSIKKGTDKIGKIVGDIKKSSVKVLRKNKGLEEITAYIHNNPDDPFVRVLEFSPKTRVLNRFLLAVYPLFGDRICIIGMEDSGISTLYENIKMNAGVDYQEIEEEYHVCLSYTNENNELFKISKGKYIGTSFIQPWHKDLIKTNDSILFLLDINRYCQEKSYRRLTHSFLDYINRKNQKDIFGLANTRNMLTLLTHADKLKNPGDGVDYLLREIKDKDYKDIVTKNFTLVNLLNDNEVNKLLEKIFKKK